MRVRLILPALIATALVALVGCGSTASTGATPDGGAAPKSGAAPKGAVANGAAAAQPAAGTVPANLTFTATTLDGKPFDGASLAGHPVVLWFWAPWCATCASEAQSLSDLAPEYKGKVDIIGVAGMGQEKEMHQFVSDFSLGGMTHLSDNAGTVWRRFGITEQSLYVVLDRAGNVVVKGFLDSQQISAQLAKLAAA